MLTFCYAQNEVVILGHNIASQGSKGVNQGDWRPCDGQYYQIIEIA